MKRQVEKLTKKITLCELMLETFWRVFLQAWSEMSLRFSGGKLTTSLTGQRRDNENAHSVDDTEPFCLDCSRAVH